MRLGHLFPIVVFLLALAPATDAQRPPSPLAAPRLADARDASVGPDGSTPLHQAVRANDDKTVEALIKRGADVMITPAGVVKVLDFGLAKTSETTSSPDLTNSPTLSVEATLGGVVLGTAAYMSPEQARGQSVDKRCDVWAFGCVLYEMLTRRKAFAGATPTDTLAAIIEREPDWTELPPQLPTAFVSC